MRLNLNLVCKGCNEPLEFEIYVIGVHTNDTTVKVKPCVYCGGDSDEDDHFHEHASPCGECEQAIELGEIKGTLRKLNTHIKEAVTEWE